jgi:hypothetical protein
LGKKDQWGCGCFGHDPEDEGRQKQRCCFMDFDSRVQRQLPTRRIHKACEGANFSAIFVDAHGIIPCLRLAWWSIALVQERIG